MSQLSSRSSGPYAPTTAGMGGRPTTLPDIPICAVFIFIYLSFAATHQVFLKTNNKRGHRFLISFPIFGFCMARMGTLVLRIAWSQRPTNIRLAIAAQIFVNIGILMIYVVNLIFAQRILRAVQPRIGWNRVVRKGYLALYISLGLTLVLTITSVVLNFYTLNTHTKKICRDIQLACTTWLFIFASLPVFHFAAAFLLPSSINAENFGKGSIKSKSIILAASTGLCMLIAGFKTGVTWSPLSPATNPPWYDGKPAFYVFVFVCEILLLCVLTFGRVDLRFHIPNGSTRPGDYSRGESSGTSRETVVNEGMTSAAPSEKSEMRREVV